MYLDINKKRIYYGVGRAAGSSSSSSSGESTPPANIVFLHGAGFDHSVWVMPSRFFARRGLNVLAPDFPGHGRSEGPPLQSIESMADWLAELIKQTCINKGTKPGESSNRPASLTIVGHSMGSLVAMSFAQRHGHLCDKIALLGASSPMRVGPPLLDAAADNDPAAFSMANTWSHVSGSGLGSTANPGMSNFISGSRWLQRMPDDVYYADLAACNQFELDISQLQTATLVVAGHKDKMTPVAAGRQVAKEMPNSELVTIADCGHSMLSERPNEVLDALSQFVL